MPSTAPFLTASGNISPCRFVQFTSGTDNTGSQVDTLGTDLVLGVSADTTRAFDSAYAAISGDAIPLQDAGAELIIEAGAAITAGASGMSDASGKVITLVSAAGVHECVTVLESAVAAGDKVKCMWFKGSRGTQDGT